MHSSVAISLPRNTPRDKVFLVVASPLDIEGEEVERISLDLRAKDVDFAGRFAAYRNAMAEAQGKRLKRKWTRKSVVEASIAQSFDAMRAQIAAMLADVGPLPDAEDAEAMARYVRKVLAWDKRK